MSVRRFAQAILALCLIVVIHPSTAQDRLTAPEGVVVHGQADLANGAPARSPYDAHGGAQAFVRTELFFGTSRPGGVVTPEEFQTFLDDVVTPLFPDGLTVVRADGQFKGAAGRTVKEASFLLILLYPEKTRWAGSHNIDRIRAVYVRQYQQESVLRVDDPSLVWVKL